MKALVTGASGFLGAALVDRLLERRTHEVRCLMRPGSARARLEEALGRHPGAPVEVVTGSLGSPAAVAPLLDGIDVVFHLAAALRGAPADLFLNNVVCSNNLLSAVAGSRRRVRLVLVSSLGVYGVAGLPRGSVIDERTPLEGQPQRRDSYSHSKLRQELLFWEYARTHGLPLVVLRPGAIYGPGAAAFSSRVGLVVGGVLLHLGGGNTLPLSYVENCAEAVVVAACSEEATGKAFNVYDDALPTSREYLRAYRRRVGPQRAIPVPYPLLLAGARALEWYSRRSKGQLPAVLTPYRVASTWKGFRFDNSRLKSLGWRSRVTIDEGLDRTFTALRSDFGHP